MPGVCYNPYGCDWTFAKLWHSIDWLVRADIFALGFMLAYVVFVVIRHRFWARDTPGEILRAGPTGLQSIEIVVSEFRLNNELIISTSNLKSIVVVAPYLGLAGTCLGILSALSYGVAMERNTFLAWVSSRIAAQLLPTAAGILVAIPAAWSHNYLRGHVERLERMPRGERFSLSHTLPLPRRFSGLPAYPLMAAPSLPILIAVFTIFAHPYTATGFDVRLNREGEAKPILVAVVNDQTSGAIAVYADSKRVQLDTLSDAIRAKVKTPDSVIDLQADGDVKWADLMNVMDVLTPLKAKVVLVKESRAVQDYPLASSRAKNLPSLANQHSREISAVENQNLLRLHHGQQVAQPGTRELQIASIGVPCSTNAEKSTVSRNDTTSTAWFITRYSTRLVTPSLAKSESSRGLAPSELR